MNDAAVIEVVRRSVSVDCAVEEAFRIFAADATSWWPVSSHSLHGDSVKEVVFEEREGGEVYELTEAGERGHWATVVTWEPPHRLVLAWEVSPSVIGTEVEVRFLPEDDGTRVELEHRGWEHVAEDAPAKRDDYDSGWAFVLGKYGDRAG
ncbi:MAG TPA: SRPBCC domain-containing protein [Gaiellaceae bacterium]|nr:SRPBCC domain-containing protein [Gaiellaceae bacterium]